ncbi:hypothetical protein [Synechococcus phage S-B28]|jgi:hypothetical protein|uniref:Uncharacterized protein n=1 Tax=Synechococcus phage S-B28 TaxID=2545435 RepID=A0A482IEZ7_9CAUD|nr:hypothetical protein HOV28_gp29 [Synechococcus phage S-B28]QBP05824.1 hypothetical protein [Synechococcus phage S-B28]
MASSIDRYLKSYTSGHSDARKMKEMFENPGKYSYDDFRSQLAKAKNIPQYEDFLGNYDDNEYAERQATKKYDIANSAYLGVRSNLLTDFLARQQASKPSNSSGSKAATDTAPATAPQARLQVQAPTTPTVSTNQSANQVAALQKALADAQASFQSQMGQQTQSYQSQLADYQSRAQQQFQTFQQQSQAQLAAAQQQADESQRQMMIGLAQRDRAPAEVKMAESGTAQQGLTRRGTTGYFGRQGMRIGSLNVPSSGLTISTDAAGRAASGSFM